MATPSPLTGPALQASRAALSAALADTPSLAESTTKEDEIEPGEIQEVDMQAQAETIRTVFSDPTNFNVKVNNLPLSSRIYDPWFLISASPLLSLDLVVRFSYD